jgi:ribose-phosphate pyrophosphokinase
LFADDLVSAVGVDEIITINPHNQEILHDLKTPVTVLSEQLIFQDDLAYFVAQGFEFVFPDSGALLRHRWLLEIFPGAMYHSFIKQRHQDVITLLPCKSSIGSRVIVYDDILDSGQTLVQVCKALQFMGVQEIVIFVTHAFFHGTMWMELFNLGVVSLYCTNSLPEAHLIKHERIHVKSISFLLQKII